VKDNLNPVWETAIVELSTLCQGDLNKPILVSVFDYESKGKHVPMGKFETTVKGLQDAGENQTQFTLKEKGTDVGKVLVIKAEVAGVESVTQKMAATSISAAPRPAAAPAAAAATPRPAAFVPPAAAGSNPSFVDYISGGCELNVTVAIDFTGSNGDPRKPGTLHYLHKDGQKNDYEKAISAIVKILGTLSPATCYYCCLSVSLISALPQHCSQV
jgi:hypothetical protein